LIKSITVDIRNRNCSGWSMDVFWWYTFIYPCPN